MPVGLFSLDEFGAITLCNPQFTKMFDLHDSQGNRYTRIEKIQDVVGSEQYNALIAASRDDLGQEIELCVAADNAAPKWFLARVASKGDSIEGSIQDITTRKEAETKLRHLVDHDSLTGLLNRRGLEEAIRVAQDAVARGGMCAIAHVDLDRFKLTNDLYGHATGDALLQQTANRLSGVVRGSDYVARIADSFVVVLMDCPDHAVVGLTERLREAVSEQPFELEGKSLAVTVSIGVVSLETSMSGVDAMAAADRACSEAKSRGRNCVVRLTDQDATLKSHLEELKMVANLQRRIETDRYFLEFQPIVSLRSAHQSLSYEVLIRMRGEDGGVVPPGRFIGAAERNGLMSQIDRWVLRSTLEWLDANPEHRDRLTFATINFSGASLNDARFVEDAFAMVAEHPLAMTKLCFEVTESVALHDVGSTRRFVDRVRAYGSKVALDDFGAGYTSFNYLKEIPADFIKIDGSFVRDINQNPANYAITRTIVDLTHELGMSSIAEWAESADTVASLIELGVDYAQGFGLARPMPKELVTQAMSSGILVRDAQVQTLLSSSRKLFALHPAGSRRR
jgi:diguanylate cyclase (GGDEF)-like protein